MKQKIKLPKNRIFVTILIATVLMFTISVVSAFFLLSTAVTSFYRDCGTFDSGMEKVAAMAERENELKKTLLTCYARILQTTDGGAPGTVFDEAGAPWEAGFEHVLFLSEDGETIGRADPLTKEDINGLGEILFRVSEKPEADQGFYMGSCPLDRVFYAVPCNLPGDGAGFLIGIAEAQMATADYDESMETFGGSIYLLNEEDQVIMYSGGEGRQFQYEKLDKNLFYREEDSAKEQINRIFHTLEEQEGKGNLEVILQGDQFVWYEKPLTVSGQEWKLVAGNKAAISRESLLIIRGSALLVAFIILFSFVLMLGLMISQSRSNSRLSRLAYVDSITGYHNWTRFQIEAGRILVKRRKNASYVIASLDICKFRVISDMYGEKESNAVLKLVADIVKKQLVRQERFCRFGIDEFAILLLCGSEEEAERRVRQIHDALKREEQLGQIEFCCGIYLVTDRTLPVHKMYNYAGIAKDGVKNSHDSNIGIFNADMRAVMICEKQLEEHMEEALVKQEFQVYLQPKYSTDGEHIGGAEALVRWVSPELGFISPGAFIPLFEKNGFITKLDIYMLRKVCELQKKWIEEGREQVTISVNLSRAHLLDPQLVGQIIKMVDFYGIPYSSIELELTESAFFEDKQVLLETVERLGAAGFCISMDDFGSGYSSLNSLKDLPLDVVKLDGEFFRETDNKGRSETVIKDTISLAKHLDMKIVAEGIEKKEQVDFLKSIGCDLIQGYYFAKPMPVSDFEQLFPIGGRPK